MEDLSNLFASYQSDDESSTAPGPPDSDSPEIGVSAEASRGDDDKGERFQHSREKERIEEFLKDGDGAITAEIFKLHYPQNTYEKALTFFMEYEVYYSDWTVNPITIIQKSISIYVELLANRLPDLLINTGYVDLSAHEQVALFKASPEWKDYSKALKDDWQLNRFKGGCGTVQPFYQADINRTLPACNHGIQGRLMGLLLCFAKNGKFGPRGGSW
jgi:hypothetical protein